MTITELRQQIGEEMGLGSWWSPFDGSVSAYGDLSEAQKAELSNRMFEYIRNHPSEFTALQVQQANTFKASPPDESSHVVSEFLGAVEDEAADLNPVSSKNRNKTIAIVAGLAAVGILAYFYAVGGGTVNLFKPKA